MQIVKHNRGGSRCIHGMTVRAPSCIYHRRAGITLMELLISIWILGVLIALLVVGIRAANDRVSRTADHQAVRVLKIAVEQFRTDHGFLPPLVRDEPGVGGPPLIGSVISVYQRGVPADLTFLRDGNTTPDYRFSIYSLGLYLFGPLDEALDGVDGPGFREPAVDGTFRVAGGKVFDPVVDGSSGMKGLVVGDPADEGRFEIRDRRGVPFRYYMWERGNDGLNGDIAELPRDLNMPEVLGDPTIDTRLKSADYAIVGAGPNGFFGDEFTENLDAMSSAVGVPTTDLVKLLAKARADNVVEVGTR